MLKEKHAISFKILFTSLNEVQRYEVDFISPNSNNAVIFDVPRALTPNAKVLNSQPRSLDNM